MEANKKYKDSVFTLLFKDKKKLIELYNAIEGKNYKEEAELEINTLEDALYMDKVNDISFLLDGKLIILVEHQSTINDNMPLRFLLYIARVYEKLVDNKAIYHQKLIKIPTPEFIVLYNGDKSFPAEKILKLSDAFLEKQDSFELDLQVKVININYEKENPILQQSETLKEYSFFIYQVKKYRKQKKTLEESIKQAIQDCMKQGVLEEFLIANGSEVVNMLYTEFNLEDAKEVWIEEGREEGREEGKEEERRIIALSLLDILDVNTISIKTGLSIKEIESLKISK